MDTLRNIRPRLIEPGVKYFMSSTLEQCHNFKSKYYNLLYNLQRKYWVFGKVESILFN